MISSRLLLLILGSISPLVLAFQIPSSSVVTTRRNTLLQIHHSSKKKNIIIDEEEHVDNHDNTMLYDDDILTTRRSAMVTSISTLVATAITISTTTTPAVANAVTSNPSASPAEKDFLQSYEDFTSTSEGWSYKDIKIGKDIGNGGDIKDGDRVVFDWSGYTIGYFGRPFEAKGGPKGGAFDKDLNYFRTTLGSKTLIPGLECALRQMKPGGIRQVIIPYGPLSYPPEDKEHELVGPKPTTFSGMRALNFVLDNPRVDRTLLFNVKLIRVDRGDGKGGFIRG